MTKYNVSKNDVKGVSTLLFGRETDEERRRREQAVAEMRLKEACEEQSRRIREEAKKNKKGFFTRLIADCLFGGRK